MFVYIIGNWFTLRAGNSIKIILPPFWKGVYCLRKEFAPQSEQMLSFKSILLFTKGFVCMNAGFQVGFTFSTFLCSYFYLPFFLKMPYYTYFEVIKHCIFFLSLASLAPSLSKSDQLYLSSHNAKAYKIFYFSCNSFSGTFILVFPFHGDVVLMFRENFVCVWYLFLSLKHSKHPYFPNFSWLKFLLLPYVFFFNFEPYFIPTFWMEGTWKPMNANRKPWKLWLFWWWKIYQVYIVLLKLIWFRSGLPKHLFIELKYNK